MDIAQKCNQSAHDEWREISCLLQKMYKGHSDLKEKDLLEFLSKIVVEYEKQHMKRKRNDNKQYCQELVLEDLFDCSIELVLMISKSDETRMILSERRKLELKCISARTVKKFGIPQLLRYNKFLVASLIFFNILTIKKTCLIFLIFMLLASKVVTSYAK